MAGASRENIPSKAQFRIVAPVQRVWYKSEYQSVGAVEKSIKRGYEMQMTSEEINCYEILETASKGGRTKEWFFGETDSNTFRNSVTEILLADGYLEVVRPVRSTPFRTTESGETLFRELSNKFLEIRMERQWFTYAIRAELSIS